MVDIADWHHPISSANLEHQHVHIWRAFLDLPVEQIGSFQQILSTEEVERAERFVFDSDRRDYVAGRGILRTLLAGYLKIDASQVLLAYTDHGKPFLANQDDHGLRFNVSHSNGVALYAITRCGPVGIDVEFERPLDDLAGMARLIFSDREISAFEAIPPAQRVAMFYRYWTCKESLVKAIGEGLSFGVQQLEFFLKSGRLTLSSNLSTVLNEWQITEFVPAPGYAGAVAVDASQMELRFWQYDPAVRWPLPNG